MQQSRELSPAVRLSICITTFNRGAVIAATLDSIASQLTSECEIVIVDGGSTDNTESVVCGYARTFRNIRYIRQTSNGGFDRDCDRAVSLAAGQYCWLTSDDDIVKPGAVKVVLEAIDRGFCLVVTNVEFRDFTLSKIVQPRWLDLQSDREYSPHEMDCLLADLGGRLLYVGGIVLQRTIWMTRNRERYYDSWFVFVGVLFQERLPGKTLVFSSPLVEYRMSNTHAWTSSTVELVWFTWPSVVWSLCASDTAKSQVCAREPWRRIQELLVWRALGAYSMKEFRRFVRPHAASATDELIPAILAAFPGVLANAILVVYFSLTGHCFQRWRQATLMLHDLRHSRFYFPNVFRRGRRALALSSG